MPSEACVNAPELPESKYRKKYKMPPKLARLAHANCGDPGKKGKTSERTH